MVLYNNYNEWHAHATRQDKRNGAERWRSHEESSLYDNTVIRYRYDELREIRAQQDPKKLLYYLNEGLHGNMGGMGTPALYSRSLLGTKTLIHDYLEELALALKDLAATDNRKISRKDKVAYLRRASICFGRSALMFSGAGSLGAFHIGVAKELAAHDLLPRIVSGASAGSLVAAVIGTHTREELTNVLDQNDFTTNFEALVESEGPSARPRQISQDDLITTVESLLPDLTFAEAYDLTGVSLNVSVAPSELHQRSRMLNAIVSPNAFIREAVIASCAIPGVFPPVTLMAKDGASRKPYVASRTWVDGSITDDQPAKRIARQYGVNHFISSQANPLVVWGMNWPGTTDNLLGRVVDIQQRSIRDGLRIIYPTVMDAVRNIYPLNTYTRFWFSMMTQEYKADINLIPPPNVLSPFKVLSHLSNDDTAKLILAGQRATWPKLAMIENCTKVSRTIDDALAQLEQR